MHVKAKMFIQETEPYQ